MTNGPIGSDGLTSRERMEAEGWEFDENGRSITLGYGTKLPGFDDGSEWEWFNSHKPDLELRCAFQSRRLIALVWRAPDGQWWYRTRSIREQRPLSWTASPLDPAPVGPGIDFIVDQRPLLEFLNEGNIPVMCPEHALALVPAQWVIDEAASTRRAANVLCTDPHPVYRKP